MIYNNRSNIITIFGKIFGNKLKLFAVSSFVLLFSISHTFAQSDTSSSKLKYPLPSNYNYPFSTSGNTSPLFMTVPSVEQSIEYDPLTNSYQFNEKIGSLNYTPPVEMNFDQYKSYSANTEVSNYWFEKSQEDFGAGPSFLNNLRLGNQSVDRVFGGEGISITPSGSAKLTFGYSRNTNENPAISIRNRRNGSFIFEQEIIMNVTGSIGDKMDIGLNYNTEATFDFENKTKLEYNGKEDEIIKKIQAGDVSFPVPGNLITGSQSLFGLRTDLQFGRLSVSTVVSHQRSESSSINVQGGAQLTEYEVNIDEYDENRHFFLAHFFQQNYNEWLKNLPHIESQVQIMDIQVWVENKQSRFETSRDIVAIMDIGESRDKYGNLNVTSADILNDSSTNNAPADNAANEINNIIDDSPVRNIQAYESKLGGLSSDLSKGLHYLSMENARPLSNREYTVNRELGYISLNSPLRNDEILAVAFSYRYKGKTYVVGELTAGNTDANNALVVKLLKGTTQSPRYKNWDLMMKNVYAIGAYQVGREGFMLDVLYRDDNTGVATNYLKAKNSPVYKQILLSVVELDNLDLRNEPYPDGIFDFVEGTTINSRNGRIIFPVTEPFGKDLRRKIVGDTNINAQELKLLNRVADRYVFEELYDSTKTKAEQIAEKNKFVLRGRYKSSSSSEIQLNAMNIPRGSVKVSAGGVPLQENQDFTVDYTLGRVKILNQGLLESGTPIRVTLESNSFFNMQTKTLMGTHLDYKFSENFNLGGTFMRLTERPLTQKSNMGEEPISNIIWGLNTSYRTETQWLTTLVDKIPLIETKEVSSIALDAEFAQLVPGQAKTSKRSDQENSRNGIAYIDDFEGAETRIELKSYHQWHLASPPKDTRGTFKNSYFEGLNSGFNRGKIAWYSVDNIFNSNNSLKPGNLSDEDIYNHYVRQVYQRELFPNKDDDISGFPTRLSLINLNFYPRERGPYNFNPLIENNRLPSPEDSWGGIMRDIITTDFEENNIEYIEFWMMSPYTDTSTTNFSEGNLYIHLGEISEDILPDSKKQFENGLPMTDVIDKVDTTVWGRIPSGNSLIEAFATDPESRKNQDVGLDGLNNDDERKFYSERLLNAGEQEYSADYLNQFGEDISGDDFDYFLGDEHDDADHNILERYKNYNGLENNSPPSEENDLYPKAFKTTPDIEDINGDNTLNTTETYFQYKVSLSQDDLEIGSNFIVDSARTKSDKNDTEINWYQFRVPLSEFESQVGPIEDFKSIRFIRLMLSGFSEPVFLRFATLEFIRGEWRKYNYDVHQPGPVLTQQNTRASFEVSSVNIEENGNKTPVNYVLPPDITRVTDPSQPQQRQLNEQSLQIKVKDLEDYDARAVFKNVQLDLRQYSKLKCFVHAEAIPEESFVDDDEITAFIRFGSDYQNNYYEYEVPLEITPKGVYRDDGEGDGSDARAVWPDQNQILIELQKFVKLKEARNAEMKVNNFVTTQTVYTEEHDILVNDEKYRRILKVRGNPNLSNIRQIMIGVRNPGDSELSLENDGDPKSAEIWFNELRLTDFNDKGGWAATGHFQAKLADLGIVNIAGATSKPGFGGIEQKIEERQKEEINQIDASTNLELGKFFPEKANVTIPMYFGISQTIINPEYYPNDPDRTMESVLNDPSLSQEEKTKIKKDARDFTGRTSFNLTNVRWNKQFEKIPLLSPGNWSGTIGYSESSEHNYTVDYNTIRKYGGNINYVYNYRPQPVEPFKKVKALRKPYLRIIRDINFNYAPSAFTFSTKMDRNYQTMKLRNIYENSGEDFKIIPTTSADLSWDRNYTLKWDLARNLKFNYKASNNAIIYEPTEERANDLFNPRTEQREYWKDSIWNNIQNFGENMHFNQNFDLSYTLPINKIPLFNWTNIRASYGGTYDWLKGERLRDASRNLGNTIKNSNSLKLQANLNVKNLYNKVGYFKKLDRKYSSGAPQGEVRFKEVEYQKRTFFKKDNPKNVLHNLGTENVSVTLVNSEGGEVKFSYEVESKNKISVQTEEDITGATITVVGKIEKGPNPIIFIADNTVRLLLGLKNVNIAYSNTSSTVLPGYMGKTDLFGLSFNDTYHLGPELPFILGRPNENIISDFNDKNWLTKDTTFSKPTIMANTETYNYRGTYEPFKGLRIDISGTYSHSTTDEQYYTTQKDGFNPGEKYQGGNYSRSIISIGTTFEDLSSDNQWQSDLYDDFKRYRKDISSRQYEEWLKEYGSNDINIPDSLVVIERGYSKGYNSTSQDVLIPAFIAAYTGQEPEDVSLKYFSNIALPNWRITFDGLSRIELLKKVFKSITFNHSYKSTYSIGSYMTNLSFYEYNKPENEGTVMDIQNNFISETQIGTVTINEQLSPLIGVDMTWHNSLITKFEIKKTRTLSLSTSNNMLTESHNDDLVFGAGYRFKDVPLNITTVSGERKRIESDVNLRFDLSIRDNVTLLRSIVDASADQASSGMKKIVLSINADYVISERLSVTAYADYMKNTPHTSRSYRNSETNFGFSMRMTL